MTYPTGLCVVATEALVLLLLWIALRVNMARLARPFVACAGLSGAWGAWVLVVVLRAPASMLALATAVFALGSVATAIAIHLATCDEEEHDDGGAGGAPRSGPEAPTGGGGDAEPMWWPEFERRLAAYADQRERQGHADPPAPISVSEPSDQLPSFERNVELGTVTDPSSSTQSARSSCLR